MKGEFVGVVYNVQDSEGWMEVKDHFVLSGAATTRQSFSYRDEFRTLDAARRLQKRVMVSSLETIPPLLEFLQSKLLFQILGIIVAM
jgi:hypothetical protein